jgi:hypothetical protein
MSNNTLMPEEELAPKKDEEAGLDEYEQSAQYLNILFNHSISLEYTDMILLIEKRKLQSEY